MMDAETRTASYYDQTAAAYDGQMEGAAVTALRDAFRERVAAATPRGGRILDFGCGTGMDAEWYAARGFRVIAYDISAGMVDQLRRRCAASVAAQTVTPLAGPWKVLAGHLQTVDPVDTVAANFAVLNHFADLGAALRQFMPYLAGGGAVAASLLSPVHLRDVRRRWWWAAALRSRGRGALTVHGAVTTHRFLPRTLRRAAAPELTLAELLGIESGGGASALRLLRPRTLLRAQFWLALWRKH